MNPISRRVRFAHSDASLPASPARGCTRRLLATLMLSLLALATAGAGQVELHKFALLREGMSEAEVYYRLGPFDYENTGSNPYHEVYQKTWYYLPDGQRSGEWITEITFDQHGRVKRLDRYKPGR